MKKTISALLIVVLLLAGCSSSTGYVAEDSESKSTMSGNASAEIAPMEPGISMDNGYYDKGDYEVDAPAEDSMESPSPEPSAPPSDDSALGSSDEKGYPLDKIIYTADVTLETQEFDKAVSELAALVQSFDGYFQTRQLNQGGNYRSQYCVIRIPVEHYAEFLTQAGEVAHMTYSNESSQNVSEAYYDLESRLATQRTKLARLQELLAKAQDVWEVINIESAISDTEWQIDNLTRQLRGYDNRIAYSTINVSLREVYRLTEEDPAPMTFGARVSDAFSRGIRQCVENFEDFVLFVVMNWLNLIVFAAAITIVVIVIVRHRRKKRDEMPVKREKPQSDSEDEK